MASHRDPSLHFFFSSICTFDLPTTVSRKYAYADDSAETGKQWKECAAKTWQP